ncbi:MAG: SDR family oxidoreductase [Planctomycetota bacterium]
MSAADNSPATDEERPVAVVTGAGGGIGAAFTRLLADLGYGVVAWDRDEASLTEVAGAAVEPYTADVSDAAAWDQLVANLRTGNRRVTLLVNNAGVLMAGRLAESDPAELRRLIEINLLGAMLGCRAMAPMLTPSVGSRPPLPVGVLNVASIFASLTPPGFAAYNASKAGLVGLTETLRGEWRPLGLTATAVLPGVTRTGLFRDGRFTNACLAATVVERGQAGQLSPDLVADLSLAAYSRRRAVAPIGKRATLRHKLMGWAPGLVRRLVVREANAVLVEADKPPM